MGQPAARVGDLHVCPMVTPAVIPVPHVGGPILPPGAVTVLIGGMPAAALGDICTCVGPPDVIIRGSFTVLIGGRPAARMGDNTAHGGMITIGCPTVLIGDVGVVAPGDFPVTILSPLDALLHLDTAHTPSIQSSSMRVKNEESARGNFPIVVMPHSWWDELAGKPLIIKYGNIEILPDPKDPTFQARVIYDLVYINSTPSGHKLLDSINRSGKKVTIKHKKGRNQTDSYPTSDRKPDGTPGTPSIADIGYDPDRTIIADGSQPWHNRPAGIGLAHELIHADHATHGTAYPGKSANDSRPNLAEPGKPDMQDNDELQTVGVPMPDGSPRTTQPGDSGVTENQIRKEWPNPQPQRGWYDG